MVFFPVILQNVEGVKGLPDQRKRIKARLAEWKEGKFKGLVKETLPSLRAAQCKSQGDTTPEHRARVFDNKVKRGQLSSAVSYIAESRGGSLLSR